ncbi:MAG: hypothetical protein CVV27_14980 [Candidatus Melainabacteria bacterium HGW-Melainabacteria-1]|nr:MAG: hypothetical protein CVV27_14980 [Candidatus Melainabacteria bacterium HGW-Melainabacteria-1]
MLVSIGLGFSCVILATDMADAAPQSAVREPALQAIRPFDIRAHFWGNLFYQLDCLAGQGYCSEAAYRSLWQTLGWNREDEAALAKWKMLKLRYGQQLQLSNPEKDLPLPPRFDGIRIWDKVREAGLNARNRQELLLNLAAVMRPTDAEDLGEILFGFEARFDVWWRDSGQALAEAGGTAFVEQLQQHQLPDLIERASRFYQAKLSSRSVFAFNFLARPTGGEPSFNGEQLENHSLIEVMPSTQGLNTNLDVTLHELCHYFYARVGREEERRLMAHFAAAQRPEAIAAYNLLNEALATAIGNGLVNRLLMGESRFDAYLRREGSFYNDPFLDPLAKAIYPRVEQALVQAEHLSDAGFVMDYLALAERTLGERLRSPMPLLRTMAAAYDGPQLAPVLQDLQRRLRVGASWGANGLDARARGTFETFSALSGVLLLRHTEVSKLSDWEQLLGKSNIDEIKRLAPQKLSMVYGIRRNPSSYVFVMIAPHAQGFNPLIERLANADTVFEGLLQ